MVPPASDRVSRARPYSGSQTAVLVLRVRGSHPLRPAFPCRSARTWFCNCGRGLGAPGSASRNTCEATAPALAPSQVWARALSLAATRAISVDFSSSGYLDVSVPPVPFHTLWIGVWMTEVSSAGFPHSEISGSKDICSSPKLIAAYHVLHRLREPRHPPCALVYFPYSFAHTCVPAG